MLFSSVALKALSPCQNGREGNFCYYFVTYKSFNLYYITYYQYFCYLYLISASESEADLLCKQENTETAQYRT